MTKNWISSEEDLKKVVANLLGFSRKGVNVDAAAERAIQLLIQQGKLKDEIGRIVLNSNNL